MKTNDRECFQADCQQQTKLELCDRVMCVLRFKTRVATESLLFTYLSIHFILSVPQVQTAVFLSPSAESGAVRGAERTFPTITSLISTCQPCVYKTHSLLLVNRLGLRSALVFLLADGDSIDIASGCLSHTSFASQLN